MPFKKHKTELELGNRPEFFDGSEFGIVGLERSIRVLVNLGSMSTVVGDEKLTSRENLIGFLFFYVQSDENTLLKVSKVSKPEA